MRVFSLFLWHASALVRGRIFMSARIGAGSRFKRFLCSVMIDIRCSRVLSGVLVPQVEDHCLKLLPVLAGTELQSEIPITS
jgi:hypothetical protein